MVQVLGRVLSVPVEATNMESVGRNAPCPCGSGRKFKKCCLATAEAITERPAARDPGPLLDDRLTPDLLEYADDNLGEAYDPETAFSGNADGDPHDETIFIPWALYHYPVNGKTVVEWYLLDRGPTLGRAKREWLEAQKRAHFSYWEATEVRPGEGLTLRCLLTGIERRVKERTASRMLSPWQVLLAQVVEYDRRAYIIGCHQRVLPPAPGAQARDRVRKGLGVRTMLVPEEVVRDPDTTLLLVKEWYEGVREQDAPRPLPRLQNTDGHEMVMISDRHSFDPAKREEVLAALCAMKGAEPDREEEGEVRISFTRPGNRQIKGWSNTIVGTGTIGAEMLTLETNSAERAAALLRRVRKACPGLLIPVSRDRKSADYLLREGPRGPLPEDRAPPAPTPPEVLPFLLQMKERVHRGWMEEEVPALGGLTPRMAAKSRKWRPALDILVKEMEQSEARAPEEERVDLSFLRRELGLG